MSDMSEVGVAAVRIVPVAKGFTADLTRQIGGEVARAAKKAGSSAGDVLADGITKAARKAGADAADALAAGVKKVNWPPPTGLANVLAKAVKDVDWPPPTGLPKAITTAARKAGDEAADVLGDSIKNMNWPPPTGLPKAVVPAARKAGDEAGDELAEGIEDGVDGGSGKLRSAASRVGEIFTTALAGAGIAAAGLLVAGFDEALGRGQAQAHFQASLGGNPEWAAAMGDIAGNLYLEGFGESIEDTGAVLRKVIQAGLLDVDASNADLEALTTQVLTFSDVLQQDADMTTQALQSMIKSGLADSTTEALDLLTTGVQRGNDKAGDLLETFQEYSVQFAALGIDGYEAMGLIQQGLQGGARDADTVADALKELAIRGKDGSEASAEGFRLLNLNAEEMTAKFAQGGDAAKGALGDVLAGLQAIEDPAQRDAAAVALFGTKSEDLQAALQNLDLDTVYDVMGDVEGSTDDLGAAYDNLADKINVFKRKALDKLATFVESTVIPVIERLAAVIGPVLGGALDAVRPVIDLVVLGVEALVAAFSGEGVTSDGFVGFMEEIGVAARDVFDFVSGFATGVGELLGQVDWAGLWADAQPIFDDLSALFTEAKDTISRVIDDILAVIEEVDWEAVWADVEPILTQIGEIFWDLYDLVVEVMDETSTHISEALDVWEVFWSEHGETITTLVTNTWNLIAGIIGGLLNIIQGLIRFATAIMQGDWSAAWDAIVQILAGVVQIIWTLLSTAWSNAVALVRAFNDQIKAKVLQVWSEIVTTVKTKVNSIVDFLRGLPGKARAALAPLASALSAPFRTAGNWIRSAWNSTVGGKSIGIPGFLGFGGVKFTIPRLHTGGVFQAPPGQTEGLALLRQDEEVLTPAQRAAIRSAPPVAAPARRDQLDINVNGGDRDLVRVVQKWIRNNAGGDVQVGLGTRRNVRTAGG